MMRRQEMSHISKNRLLSALEFAACIVIHCITMAIISFTVTGNYPAWLQTYARSIPSRNGWILLAVAIATDIVLLVTALKRICPAEEKERAGTHAELLCNNHEIKETKTCHAK